MSLLSRLFGSKPPEPPKAEDYKSFRITPEPIREGSQFRIAARIEKTIDGTPRRHQLIRADTMGALDEATAISLGKARQIIDEQGDKLFG